MIGLLWRIFPSSVGLIRLTDLCPSSNNPGVASTWLMNSCVIWKLPWSYYLPCTCLQHSIHTLPLNITNVDYCRRTCQIILSHRRRGLSWLNTCTSRQFYNMIQRSGYQLINLQNMNFGSEHCNQWTYIIIGQWIAFHRQISSGLNLPSLKSKCNGYVTCGHLKYIYLYNRFELRM